jgi:dTDP-L-rhamnose 4-epimerase
VLVTGAAGFIGSHVVDALIGDDIEVVAVDALHAGAHDGPPPYLHPDAEHHRVDVRDHDALGTLLEGVDAVNHQAAMVGLGLDLGDITEYVDINALGTATLLRALHDRAFRGPLVLASSMVVYGEGAYRCGDCGPQRPLPRTATDLDAGRWEPPCPSCGGSLAAAPVTEDAPPDPRNVYAATKLHQEHLVESYAREHTSTATSLRYHNVYGPRMPRDTPYAGVASIFRSALEAGRAPQVFEDGGQTRDFVHVEDVARANVLALGAGVPGPFNVASGDPHTVLEMADALANAFEGAPAPEVVGGYRLGDVRHVFASPERAGAELGFRAGVGFAEGMHGFARAQLREPARGLHAVTEPLVRLLDATTAPLPTRPAFAAGDPGPISASLAHVPELFEVVRPFIGRALAGVSVDRRTAELVIVRASAVLGCEYCTLTHAAVALDAGVSPAEVHALCGPEAAPAARDERERALLAWVDAVAAGRGRVPPDVTAAFRLHADDATLVEITTMIGCTIFLNRYCTALHLPVSAGSLQRLAAAGLHAADLGFGATP